MARRRNRTAQSVSLFPFLSILACVIGTLTLMITALALGQLDNPAVASAEQLESAQRSLEDVRTDIERLRQQLADAKAEATDEQRQLSELKQTLQQLQLQQQALIAASQDIKTPELPVADPEAHAAKLEALKQDLAALEAEIKKLQEQIAQLNTPPDEAIVRIQPGGSGVDLKPTFIECTARGLVLLDEEGAPRIGRADMSASPSFLAVLDQVAKAKKQTIVFLVREDGLSNYNLARRIARERYARNGKLPVIGQGKIDLSQFK